MRRLAALIVLAAASAVVPAALPAATVAVPVAMHVHGHPATRVLADGMYHHS